MNNVTYKKAWYACYDESSSAIVPADSIEEAWEESMKPEHGLTRVNLATQIPSVLIVTRHPALVEYLTGEGGALEGEYVVVREHATPEDVAGRYVWGVLPLHLAVHAKRVTEIPLNLPRELRGVELNLEQVKQYAGMPVSYKVTRA